MSPLKKLIRYLKRPSHTADALHDADFVGPSDGLPRGVEPPPLPSHDQVGFAEDATKNANLGIPGPGYPNRPLHIEEAAQKIFEGDMRALSKWGRYVRSAIPALLESASKQRSALESQLERLDCDIQAVDDDVTDQREQLADRDLKFPLKTAAVASGVAAGAASLAALDMGSLQPVMAKAGDVGFAFGWVYSIVVVTFVVASSWALGACLHRLSTYEGPSRIRRVHLLGAGLFGIVGLAGFVGLGLMRVMLRDTAVVDGASAVVWGIVWFAVQAGAQLLAALHGWWSHNPRVRQLVATEAYLDRLRGEQDEFAAALGECDEWVESLNEFHVGEWLTEHRGQIAADYEAEVLNYRNDLTQALIEAGRDEAADVLLILPLPKFIPPIETDPDDPGDWLTGFMLPL